VTEDVLDYRLGCRQPLYLYARVPEVPRGCGVSYGTEYLHLFGKECRERSHREIRPPRKGLSLPVVDESGVFPYGLDSEDVEKVAHNIRGYDCAICIIPRNVIDYLDLETR
jgi:hypothetical protein